MDDKINEILDLLKSQNEMIKDIHDYVKEVTSEKYIGEYRMTSFSINLAADILTCFKGYYYVEVKEQDDKELLEAMGRVVYE